MSECALASWKLTHTLNNGGRGRGHGGVGRSEITAAMRQLAYGYPADAAAELVRVSDSLASESLIRFCRADRKKFEPDYLRRPNKDELRDIEQHYASLGFPGCIGCVDVDLWTLDKSAVG